MNFIKMMIFGSLYFATAGFVFPTLALAGTGSTGGANAVGGTLFDYYENQGTIPFYPAKHPAVLEFLNPILRKHSQLLPGLIPYLNKGLSKSWYLEPKVLDPKKCQNASMIMIDRQVVACQDDYEVRILKSWFESANQKNQAGVISHELLIYYVLKTLKKEAAQSGASFEHKKEVLEANARAINRVLIDGSSIKLRDEMKKRGFVYLMTVSEIESTSLVAKNFLIRVCAKGQYLKYTVMVAYEEINYSNSIFAKNWARSLSSVLSDEDLSAQYRCEVLNKSTNELIERVRGPMVVTPGWN